MRQKSRFVVRKSNPNPELALILVSRFNIEIPFLDENGMAPPPSEYDAWLRKRTELFETYCLPSVRAQSDRHFQWLVVFDRRRTPPWLHEKLQEWSKWEAFVPYFLEAPFTNELLQKAICELLRQRPKKATWLSTGWFDTDDMLTRSYIERVRKSFREREEAVCFPTGLRVSIGMLKQNLVYDTDSGFRCFDDGPLPIHWPRRTTAMTLFEKLVPGTPPRTVHEISHHLRADHEEVIDRFEEVPCFIKITHGAAVVNRTENFFGPDQSEDDLFQRTKIINWIIRHCNYRTYLEIGYGSGENFAKVEVQEKIAVDPAIENHPDVVSLPSDEFFQRSDRAFDLIFVDGLHRRAQFLRDVSNSLRALKPGGIILCHDVNPKSEIMQRVPRVSKAWTGDCWKGWIELRQRSDLEMWVLDAETGIGIIRRGFQTPLNIELPLTWPNLVSNRKTWLNLMAEDVGRLKIAKANQKSNPPR